uniref:G2/mitotic-specific cyclin-B2 n=1 Tax=Scophthalmus maximus TaxID=52904 RepID=A0A8D3CMX8_SCOMX
LNSRLVPVDKENIPPASRADAPQAQRPKQRAVLGVLSENEQHGRSFSKHTFPACTSSSGYDVHVEEACEVVLSTSGQETFVFLLLSCYAFMFIAQLLFTLAGPCQESSMQSEKDESLMSVEALCVSEYAEDIHQNLRKSELRFRPVPGLLEKHPQITGGMRVVLVDWLSEVVQEYKLSGETLHLAVNYLDRFLSGTAFVKRGSLQLVGSVALLIASKYEEIRPPELKDFVYITDCTYTKKQVLQMEHFFLGVLAFDMAAPTINQFLRLFMSIHSVCANTENLAMYVAELSLLEIQPFLRYSPSLVAAAAYCLASYTVNNSLWPDSLSAFTGYTMAAITPCLTDLHKLHIGAESHPQQAIRRKYMSSRYCRVASIAPPAVLPSP